MPVENLTWFAATVVSWQSKPNADMAQTPSDYCIAPDSSSRCNLYKSVYMAKNKPSLIRKRALFVGFLCLDLWWS